MTLPNEEHKRRSKPTSGWRVLVRVCRELAGYRWQLFAIAVLGALTAPLALLQPFAMKVFLDSYVQEPPAPLPAALDAIVPDGLLALDGRLGYMLVAIGLIVLPTLVSGAIGFYTRLLRTRTRERLVLDFRIRLFRHVERLSLSYHDQEGPSHSTFKVMMDTAVVPGILMGGVIPMLQALVVAGAICAVLLTKSWQFTALAAAVAGILLLVTWPFGRNLRRQWHTIKELQTDILANLQEIFSAVRVVKAFGREQGETDRLFALAEKGLDARMAAARTQSWFGFVNGMSRALGIVAFIVVGGALVRSGDAPLSVGDLFLIAGLMVQLYSPMQMLVGQVSSMQAKLASAERVLALLDRAPEVVDRPGARAIGRARGDVEFRDVRFGYEADDVIDGVSFVVPARSRIGIAGHTGAGKTTLMSLLTRLYDPREGAILLDGVDVRDIELDSLREQFSIVLQEPVLFKTTIAENIRYGVSDASDEQVREAARLANADQFIERMSDGYETVVGDRGQRLSGGERQRIALARAFLKDAPVLILDEPTSSVDMRTEAAIMEAVDRLVQGRTTFIIAHRPSTLETCDKVLVLEKGKVVTFAAPDAMGSLDELMLARRSDAG